MINKDASTHTHTHTPAYTHTHMHTCTMTTSAFLIHDLYTRTVRLSVLVYNWGKGHSLEGGEHSGTCYHENTEKHNKAAGDWGSLRALVLVPWLYLSQNKTSDLSLVDCRHRTERTSKKKRAGLSVRRQQLLPHGSVVIVHVLDFVAILPVVLMPHGVLVHGGVGLGRGVEGRRDAVTGLAAVVAVPVVHGAVRIVVWPHGHTVRVGYCVFKNKFLFFKLYYIIEREWLWHQRKTELEKGEKCRMMKKTNKTINLSSDWNKNWCFIF